MMLKDVSRRIMDQAADYATAVFTGRHAKKRSAEMKKVSAIERKACEEYHNVAVQVRVSTRVLRGSYLVVDDDHGIRELLSTIISSSGRKMVGTSSVREALNYLRAHSAEDIACCVVDLGLPDGSGEEVVNYLEKNAPDIPVLVYTGDEDAVETMHEHHPLARVILKGVRTNVKTLMQMMAIPDRVVDERLVVAH